MPEHPPYVFIGGVEVSLACLRALCEMGRPPALAVSYDESRADASGFADFRPLAEKHGFPLVATRDVNEAGLVERIRGLDPALSFVIGWSQLVRAELLDVPRHGSVGIHPTPLPEGRGRAPIPWTIIKGLDRTASTMFFLTEGVDDGDIVDAEPIEVAPRELASTLYAKHLDAHVKLVTENVDALLAGTAPRTPQDHERATFWPRRRPEDGGIDWSRPADEIDRLVRAVTRPFPGAFGTVDGEELRIWAAEPADAAEVDGKRVVACGSGALRILEAEPLGA